MTRSRWLCGRSGNRDAEKPGFHHKTEDKHEPARTPHIPLASSQTRWFGLATRCGSARSTRLVVERMGVITPPSETISCLINADPAVWKACMDDMPSPPQVLHRALYAVAARSGAETTSIHVGLRWMIMTFPAARAVGAATGRRWNSISVRGNRPGASPSDMHWDHVRLGLLVDGARERLRPCHGRLPRRGG